MADRQNGGSGALLVPNHAVELAKSLKADALRLGHIWTIFHSLHAPAYLFGTAPPVGWEWDDVTIRYRDTQNRELGNVSELLAIAAESSRAHILRGEDPFKRNVRAFLPSSLFFAFLTRPSPSVLQDLH